MIYKNKKIGNSYRVLASGIDCTNERDGTAVIIYHPYNDKNSIYIRETEEFYEKFVECTKSIYTST